MNEKTIVIRSAKYGQMLDELDVETILDMASELPYQKDEFGWPLMHRAMNEYIKRRGAENVGSIGTVSEAIVKVRRAWKETYQLVVRYLHDKLATTETAEMEERFRDDAYVFSFIRDEKKGIKVVGGSALVGTGIMLSDDMGTIKNALWSLGFARILYGLLPFERPASI